MTIVANGMEPSPLSTETALMTPFLPDPRYSVSPRPSVETDSEIESETPFVSSFQLVGGGVVDTRAEEFEALLDAFQDEEFDDAVAILASEVRRRAIEWSANETSFGSDAVFSKLEAYVSPLQSEMEALFIAMEDSVRDIDGEALTEAQLAARLDEFEYAPQLDDPVFEQFFKKLARKAKKLAKKGLKAAKKIAKKASKFLPVNMILRRLHKPAKLLLNHVLKFAINKLPARYRPFARKLARKGVKRLLREAPEQNDAGLSALGRGIAANQVAQDAYLGAVPLSSLTVDFDAMVAAGLLGDDEQEITTFGREFSASSGIQADPVSERARFVMQLAELEDDEDPGELIEGFVAAIYPALRLGIKLAGRRRVVKFLAGIVSRLIRKYIGRRMAKPLSRALVDAGLKLVNLETSQGQQRIASEVLANTVESTIEKFLEAVPEDALSDEAAMSYYAHQAFDLAAAEHFPPKFLRKSLRRPDKKSGIWTAGPAKYRFKTFRKLNRKFPIRLSRAAARRIPSFAGETLEQYLSEQMDISDAGSEISGELAIFDLMAGGRVTDILLEAGEGDTIDPSHIHPLTLEAAAILIPQDAELGQFIRDEHLQSRDRVVANQRFYILNIPGARQNYARNSGQMMASRTNVTLDHRRRLISVRIFLSEATAQTIRKSMLEAPHMMPRMVMAAAHHGLLNAMSGAGSKLRLIADTNPQTILSGLRQSQPMMGNQLAKRIELDLVRATGGDFLDRFANAVSADEDGAEIVLNYLHPGNILSVLEGEAPDEVMNFGALATESIGVASGAYNEQ